MSMSSKVVEPLPAMDWAAEPVKATSEPISGVNPAAPTLLVQFPVTSKSKASGSNIPEPLMVTSTNEASSFAPNFTPTVLVMITSSKSVIAPLMVWAAEPPKVIVPVPFMQLSAVLLVQSPLMVGLKVAKPKSAVPLMITSPLIVEPAASDFIPEPDKVKFV